MNFSFDIFHRVEKPSLTLLNPDETPVASIVVSELSCKLKFNALSEISFKVSPKYTDIHGNVKVYDWYEDIKKKRLVFVQDLGYFQIDSADEDDSGKQKYKQVRALSLQNEFTSKKVQIPGGTYKFYNALVPSDETTLIGLILKQMSGWRLEFVSTSLWNKYRTFELTTDKSLYDFVINTTENTYECIFNFDYLHKTISVTDIDDTVKRTDIYLSYKNLVKNIKVKEESNNIVTALAVYGQDLDIRKVNPLGSAYIYDFTYYKNTKWMSQDLIDALNIWEGKIRSSQVVYANLLTVLQDQNARLISLNGDLVELKGDLANQNNLMSVRISAGRTDIAEITTEINRITSEINTLESDIVNQSSLIKTTTEQLSEINTSLSFENNFTDVQFQKLSRLIEESDYTDSNYIVTDSMTQTQIQDYAQELYEQGLKVLARLAQPRYTFSLDSMNFLFLEKFKPFTQQLELGRVITVEKENGLYFYPVLLELNFSWDNPESFSMTFGNRYRLDDAGYVFADLISQTINTSKSVAANWGDLTRFNQYKDEVSDALRNALDASKNAVISSSNQELIFDQSGILCRRLNPDTGLYDPEQIKIVNNQIVFTRDGFNTVSTAVGKVALGDNTYGFGIAAEVLLGNLMATNELRVTNENNNFYMDGAGARLYNADFTIENDVSRITLSPDTGISIQKKLSSSTYEDIFYVDEEGEAFFKGNITAYSGVLGGWTIEPNGLSHSSGIYYLRSDGTGRIGLMTFTNTSATFDGNIYAKNLQAGNTILSDGSYGNAGYVGDGHIADNSISGTKLRAEYRDGITTSIAEIKVYADNTFATISSFTEFQSNVNNQIITTKTSIEQTAAATYATISSLAQYQSTTNSSIASITQDVQENGARIALVVGTGKLVDNAGNASGSIIVSAINGSSSAIISADKIDLHGYVTFTNLSASGQTTINGGNLINDSVSTDKLTSSNNQIIFNKHLLFNNPSFSEIAQVSNIYFRNGVNMYASNAGSETIDFVSGYGGSITLKVNGNTVLHSGNYQNYISSATAKFG